MEETSNSSKRPFGLSFPARPKNPVSQMKAPILNRNCPAAAAFSMDDEDDDNNQIPAPAKKVMSTFNTKDRRLIEQALQEDPTVFEYDSVHEKVSSTVKREQEIEEKRRIERETKTVRQAKYAPGLIEQSEKRKKEYELMIERKIQREREAEGELFAGKEVFVTAGYKAKLSERQAYMEREKAEEEREKLLSVERHENFDAFYRYQLELASGEAVILEQSEKVEFKSTNEKNRSNRKLRSRAEKDEEEEEEEADQQSNEKSAEKSQENEENNDDEQIQIEPVRQKVSNVKIRRINDESSKVYDDEQINMSLGPKPKKQKKEEEEKENTDNLEEVVMPLASEKKRIEQESRIERIRRLCTKRTVGEILEAAKQFFFERQQQRSLFKDYIERAE